MEKKRVMRVRMNAGNPDPGVEIGPREDSRQPLGCSGARRALLDHLWVVVESEKSQNLKPLVRSALWQRSPL